MAGRAPASHARARAAARVRRTLTRTVSSTAFKVRCVVVCDATGPNRRSWPRRPSRSVTQSPPSASITATSRSIRPGACADRRSRVKANAPDSPPISHLRQQHRPRMRHQPGAVRADNYRSRASLWLHQLSVLLDRDLETSQSRFSRPGKTVPGAYGYTLTGEFGLADDTREGASSRSPAPGLP